MESGCERSALLEDLSSQSGLRLPLERDLAAELIRLRRSVWDGPNRTGGDATSPKSRRERSRRRGGRFAWSKVEAIGAGMG